MKTLHCFLFATLLLLSASLSMGAVGSSLPVIQISQEIHDLEIDRESPKYVLIAGHLTFQWKSAELPGFSLNHLDFLNNIDEVVQTVEENTIEDGYTTVTVSFRGRFESHNNFSAYPFNEARIPVIFKRPSGEFVFQAPKLTQWDLQNIDSLSPSDSYEITKRTFLEGIFYKAHGPSQSAVSGDCYDASSVCFLRILVREVSCRMMGARLKRDQAIGLAGFPIRLLMKKLALDA